MGKRWGRGYTGPRTDLLRALPAETKVGSGTSQSKRGTSFNLSNSGDQGFGIRCWGYGFKRARIQGSKTFVSLNSRIESNKEEKKKKIRGLGAGFGVGECLLAPE